MQRVRNKPHVPGNWATLIYIPIEAEVEVPEGFEKVDSLHLSLSRTLYVKELHKDLLLKQLEKAMKTVKLPETPLLFDQPAKYSNDEGTCHFLALDLDEQRDGDSVACLQRIVKAIDGVLKGFGLPRYYDPPSFHVSLGWRIDDWTLESTDHLQNFNYAITLKSKEILMKCGNKIHKLL